MTRQDMYFSTYMNNWWDKPVKDKSSLEVVKEWIAKNLSPDEVFPKRELLTYLEDNREQLENKLPITQY